ncbi:hypothetical protein BDW59DRAFT_138634 [Aspergillus cavernicola]|uniref:Uncharacterized protein n=1 Tax=Aspergillus cavernicola TaxID=176166 RepID=A0ABR4J1L3_9EURO
MRLHLSFFLGIMTEFMPFYLHSLTAIHPSYICVKCIAIAHFLNFFSFISFLAKFERSRTCWGET